MKYLYLLLVVFVCGCQQPSSSGVGRYVQFQFSNDVSISPLILDTKEGVIYQTPYKDYFKGAASALRGEEVPDTLVAHWIPITKFGNY